MTEEKVAWNFFGETEIFTIFFNSLNAKISIIYKNQSIDLFCKSTDWFLYDISILAFNE